MKFKSKNKGQALVEFTIVLGLVVAVIFAVSPMIRRTLQSMIKTTADQIGVQQDAEQVAYEDINDGFFIGSNVITDVSSDKTEDDVLGVITYGYDDAITTNSIAEINLGTAPR